MFQLEVFLNVFKMYSNVLLQLQPGKGNFYSVYRQALQLDGIHIKHMYIT